MLSINTNLSSLIAQSSMKQSTNKLNQAIERMTTGFKINHAKDNAANYQIASQMTTQINSLQVAEENTAMGLDLVTQASDILDEMNDRVQRLRDLQEQANNATYGEDSLNAINKECNALVDEINRMYESAEYNGITLFMAPTTLADGRVVVAKESDAQLDTTFKDLGVVATHFEIFDSDDNLVQAYDLEEGDTLNDFLATLEGHGFTTELKNGEITISSTDNYYLVGDLVDELGIATNEDIKVSYTTESTTIWTTTTTETTQTNTIWTTTTSSTTQTNTVFVTTTTSQTVTETIYAQATVGVAKSSSAKVTYETVSTYNDYYYSYTPILTSTVNIMATKIEVGTYQSGAYTFETYTINSPTVCTTMNDFINYLMTTVPNISEAHFVIDSYIDGGYFMELYGTNTSGQSLIFKINGLRDFDCTNSNFNIVCYKTTTISTTNSEAATSSSKLSTIGISSTQYITVQNNGTETVITCTSSSTINNVITKLANAGITASISGGTFKISATDNAYISGMSSGLMTALNLSGDFSSTKTTSTEIESTTLVTTTTETTTTETIYTTTTSSSTETETITITAVSSSTYDTIQVTTTTISTTQAMAKQTYLDILEAVYAPGTINLMVGTTAEPESSIQVDVSFKLSDLTKFRNIGADGNDYLEQLDNLLGEISERQVQFGAVMNRLESVMDEIGIKYDNLVSSRSTIRDADIAEVSSHYIQQQILQQASATLLATANQSPSIALQLI